MPTKDAAHAPSTDEIVPNADTPPAAAMDEHSKEELNVSSEEHKKLSDSAENAKETESDRHLSATISAETDVTAVETKGNEILPKIVDDNSIPVETTPVSIGEATSESGGAFAMKCSFETMFSTCQ
ncbi:unnamed protein product [Anisakis simplex]|uniref:Uncharacterized protein n=1 Tax=Anisakis simplex TaxID=6269 RepID=A0A3P6QHS7_ANISI|nr:unnamed protein product [Anisakis simplex]